VEEKEENCPSPAKRVQKGKRTRETSSNKSIVPHKSIKHRRVEEVHISSSSSSSNKRRGVYEWNTANKNFIEYLLTDKTVSSKDGGYFLMSFYLSNFFFNIL